MRTTIDLPDELLARARAIARDTSRTLSEVVSELVRRGLEPPPAGAAAAIAVLAAVARHPRHAFWPADLPYAHADLRTVDGHRQVSDTYLAALARARGGRLATLDRALAALHPDVVELVPG